jgi:hypothetical protein
MTTWTPEQDAVLRELFTCDRSLSRMTEELNARCGTSYSRAATTGRAVRLGLDRGVATLARVWTDEQDDCFRQLWATGMPLGRIADQINERFGTSFTKNAITGRCLRFGLRRKSHVAERARPKPRPALPAHPVILTKSQMYAMLAEAVRNTAEMQQ